MSTHVFNEGLELTAQLDPNWLHIERGELLNKT